MNAIQRQIATAIAAMVLIISPVHAYTYGTPTTYGGLTWTISLNSYVAGLSGCSQIYLDATGDLQHSSSMVMYGAWNCPATGGGYPMVGTAYFGINGTFNTTLNFSNGWQLSCLNINPATLSGQCQVYDGTGVFRTYATLTFTR
jgi:hypothetical protein